VSEKNAGKIACKIKGIESGITGTPSAELIASKADEDVGAPREIRPRLRFPDFREDRRVGAGRKVDA
jgi:hypothetical protein